MIKKTTNGGFRKAPGNTPNAIGGNNVRCGRDRDRSRTDTFFILKPWSRPRSDIQFPTDLANDKKAYISRLRVEAVRRFRPRDDLERAIVEHPDFLIALDYGSPRPGHPEGSIGNHIERNLQLIDQHIEDPVKRSALRKIALIHDTFKFHARAENSPLGHIRNHEIAGAFARYLGLPENLAKVIEFHDFCFYIETNFQKDGNVAVRDERTRELLDQLDDINLFYQFTYIDRNAGDGDTTILDQFWNRVAQQNLFKPENPFR